MSLYSKRPEWLLELEIALYALDDLRMDCAGITMIVSALLQRAKLPHHCMLGSVEHLPSGSLVVPHHWVELDSRYSIDFRLRMWLGDRDDIPHGLIDAQHERDLLYRGERRGVSLLNDEELHQASEGRAARFRLPALF